MAAGIMAACFTLPGPGQVTTVQAQSLFDWDSDRPSFEDQRRREREEERRARSQRRGDYCRKLEQRLVQEWRRNNQSRGEIPAIRKELRQAEQEYRAAEEKAERNRCYEQSFFFGRELRRTPECVELDRDIQRAGRQVKSLRDRINRASRSGGAQGRQDELIAQLARHGCGEDYERQYEARRPSFFSFFDDRGPRTRERRERQSPSDLPFATYRTMCVRRCDGYYFPMSFSTLPSQFEADEAKCQERCAAPTGLFVYRNPGEDVEDMVSLDGKPYTELDNAFLYRDEFIKGCSCDLARYSEAEIAKSRGEIDGEVPPAEVSAPGGTATGASEGTGADRQAGNDQDGEDEVIIHNAPRRKSFDPRQR
ncbi:MAG: DUF2865 domain-containing protein [Dichotomicrobium sp.]